MRTAFTFFALAVVAACSAEGDAASSPEVEVVEGVRHVIVRPADFEVIEPGEPVFTVGDGSSDDVTLFRVAGGVLLPTGGAAIANAGSSEVLYFSESGALVATFGREGQGPGEFDGIYRMHGLGDGRLAVVERGNARTTFLARDRTIDQVITPRFERGKPSTPKALVSPGLVLAPLPDARFVAFDWAEAPLDGVPGELPVSGPLRVHAPDFSEAKDFGVARIATWYESNQSVDGPPIQMIQESARLVSHGWGSRWAYSEAEAPVISIFEGDMKHAEVRELRQRVPFSPDSLRRGMAEAADSLPAYRDLRVDSEGRVWVQAPSDGEGGLEWRA